jgi:large subunit ribosomal protein L3
LATKDQNKKYEVEEKEVKQPEKVVEVSADFSREAVEFSEAKIEGVDTNISDEQPKEAEIVSEDDVAIDLPFVVGKKVGMTRIFDDSGRDYPTTIIEVGPCYVTQIKSLKNDGYSSIQLGYDEITEKKLKKTQKGHLAKSGVNSLRNFKEFRTDVDSDVKLGSKIDARIFELGDIVSVTGTSKGRGFAGHMKRHGFSGGRRSHGKNSVMRKAGSIGAGSDPSRVWLGTRMAGRFGNDRVTVKNLEIIRVDKESNLVFIKGAVPGAKNGFIYIVK